ncbi:MAG: divergent polysaccharide deacetylase family protein [Proteobacteria bacterium]|nr:divergent polysaccharide deacetylase family protein [Pseudomonadota bacterium]MBI3499519.1 divergent polysaccharide deacetylase family protein [Pseudomonadota bacterium]
MRLWPLRWKRKKPEEDPGDPAPEPPLRRPAGVGRSPARARDPDDDSAPSLLAPLLGAVVLVVGIGGLVAWLALNADDTVSRRILETPRVALPLVADHGTTEPAKAPAEAAAHGEAAKPEVAKLEPPKAEPAKSEAAKAEPAKPEVAKPEPESPKAGAGHGAPSLPVIEPPKLGTASSSPAAKPAEAAHGAPPPAAAAKAEAHGAPPAPAHGAAPPSAPGAAPPVAHGGPPPMQLAARTREIGPPVVLRKAPEPALTEQGPRGPLPVVAEDGRQAWRFYGRPFDPADTRPRISIVIAELGLSSAATEAAVQSLPGAVTLAFAPYAPRLEEWMGAARAAGHEALMMLPMEPGNFPTNDPGPYTLLTSLSSNENLDRLDWVLSRTAGYVGVLNYGGTRFASSEEALQPVLAMLKRRGLLFIDGWATARTVSVQLASALGVPSALGNRQIDLEASRGAIDQRLAELEKTAREQGEAIGIGGAYPVTLERVGIWSESLADKGFALAPVSALAGEKRTQ